MIHGFIVIRKRDGGFGPKFPVKQSVKIGRGTHCDIRMHVQSVSEQHCLILVEKDQRAMIQNLSTNSQTLVNGVPIGKGTCALKHGDTVSVGERSFRWHYGPQTSFYEDKKNSSQKRRKSDSNVGSQNVAVVNPLYHKRRTLGPNVTYFDTKRVPKKTPSKSGTLKSTPNKSGTANKTPLKSGTPKKTPMKSGSPSDLKHRVVDEATPVKAATPRLSVGKSPNLKLSASKAKLSIPKSASHRNSSTKSPATRTPVSKSAKKVSLKRASAANSPVVKSPDVEVVVIKTQLSKTPVIKSPAAKSPVVKSPAAKSPDVKTLAAKSPRKSAAAKTPVGKSSASKTSIRKSSVKIGAKSPLVNTPKVKTPATKTPKSNRKSKSSAKPIKIRKGKKRRLSSPAPVASKRMKIESPKSIDKMKMAVLMGIHGRRPQVATSSTLATVKVVLSSKKTPVVKPIKTPRSSAVKKSAVKSSAKKPRKQLFSEVLKKKAIQKANSVAKKLTLVPRPPPKAVFKKVEKSLMSIEIPAKFKFGSTGHANSPEPIIIGRKVAKTPLPTKKGRKSPWLVNKKNKGNLDFSGISEMFKTPAKNWSPSIEKSTESVKETSSRAGTPSVKASPVLSDASPAVLVKSRQSSGTPRIKLSPRSTTPKSAQRSPTIHKQLKNSPPKSPSPERSLIKSEPKSSRRSSSMITPSKLSSSLTSQVGKVVSQTPQSVSKSFLLSGTKRHKSLLTSTPAAFGKRQSFAGSAFESPSSLLTGQISAPQSPTSGRKSRLDMTAPRTSYVHSPQTSPVKSSLKSSPPKSPEKHLSVSFNDSINIKLLVSGSRKSVNTTAPLSSPLSPQSEGSSRLGTPDATTFDFDSIKTPNVPREMFVSSILSSGASSSSSSKASGSAKRKGKLQKSPQNDLSDLQGVRRLMKTPTSPAGYVDVKGIKRLMTAASKKSPQNDLSDLQGVRRLMKTPTSPAGYVDVKGIKRLMTAASKTPTYLAVEGVKKLFGDAAAAAGNELSSFPGVRELFASPSPSKAKTRLSLKVTAKDTVRRSSPVAKIQAEVESKGRSSTASTLSNVESSPSSAKLESAKRAPSSRSLSSVKSPKSEASPVRTSPVTRTSRSTRERGSKPLPQKVDSPPSLSAASEEEGSTKRVRARGDKKASFRDSSASGEGLEQSNEASPVKEPALRRGRKAVKVSSPKTSTPNSHVDSPPKRKTRRAAKVSSPVKNSPAKELPKSRTRRGVKDSSPKASPVVSTSKMAKKDAQTSIKSPAKKEGVASPVTSAHKEVTSSVQVGAKKTTRRRKAVPTSPTPVKSPPTKRSTRRGTKSTVVASSPERGTKRTLLPSKDVIESPQKKTKKELKVEPASPVNASPKRATRNTRKESSSKETSSLSRKRKAVTFKDDSTPSKRGKTVSSKKESSSPSLNVSPDTNKKAKRTASGKNQQPPKKSPVKNIRTSKKTSSPVKAASPRRTRSRK